jgi:hypothetical protein
LAEHTHRFKITAHLDGCHWYSTTAACACGATFASHGERSPRDDPWSMEWLMPEACERCAELAAGAEPKYGEEVRERG